MVCAALFVIGLCLAFYLGWRSGKRVGVRMTVLEFDVIANSIAKLCRKLKT